MAEFIAEVILEMCIVTPGAFIVALAKGKPRSTAQVMDKHYLLSIIFGVALWATVAALIKFLIVGCVICE